MLSTIISTQSNNLLNIVTLKKENKNVILIGEHHYLMDMFFESNPNAHKDITNSILTFANGKNADILIEAENFYIDSDQHIWDNFIITTQLQQDTPVDQKINKSIIYELENSDYDKIIKIDIRENILDFDATFMSNICNIILNQFGFYGDDINTNNHISHSIINLIETLCIKKVIVYLIKKQKEYNIDTEIYNMYQQVINDIMSNYKSFIAYINSYKDLEGKTPDEEIVESMVYGIAARIMDLNIFEWIYTKDTNHFIVYTGNAHTDKVKQMLLSNGFTIQ